MMRIGGLATGMDTDQMVKELMTAERIPLDKLSQKKQTVEWQKDAYRELNLMMTKMRSTASSMRLQSAFNSYSASSSNSGAVKASSTPSSISGNYSVTVHEIAQSAKLTSKNKILTEDASVGAKLSDKVLHSTDSETTFQLANGRGQTSTITIETEDTFQSLADKISGAVDSSGASLGMRASFDETTSRFFLSTKQMGGDEGIVLSSFSNTNIQDRIFGAGANTAQGTFGSYEINGILVDKLKLNSSTVNNLKLDLIQKGTTTISVQSDVTSSFEKINSFVEEYNDFIEKAEGMLTEKKYRDYPPLTEKQREELSEKEIELWDEKAKSGMLQSDPILRGIVSDLRSAWMDTVKGLPSGESDLLSQIGINTGNYQSGGKLFIDEIKLKEALTSKPEEVMNLFTSGSDGIGDRLYAQVNTGIDELGKKAGSPGTLSDNSFLSKRLKDMEEQVLKWESKLVSIENRYWKQFTALETAMVSMNQQGMWIQQNLYGGM